MFFFRLDALNAAKTDVGFLFEMEAVDLGQLTQTVIKYDGNDQENGEMI